MIKDTIEKYLRIKGYTEEAVEVIAALIFIDEDTLKEVSP